MFFFFKQKTAYEWRISDWSSDVCSSDLGLRLQPAVAPPRVHRAALLLPRADLHGLFPARRRRARRAPALSGAQGPSRALGDDRDRRRRTRRKARRNAARRLPLLPDCRRRRASLSPLPPHGLSASFLPPPPSPWTPRP